MSTHTVITVTGNLAADPEIRFTPAGKAHARFRIVSTDRYKNDAGEWVDGETSGHNIVAWGRLAEHVAHLGKGDPVIAHGRLARRGWETDTGERRSTWEITATEIGMCLRALDRRSSAAWGAGSEAAAEHVPADA